VTSVRESIVSDAAGRIRFAAPPLRNQRELAVAIEDSVDTVAGVRQVHAYPRTGSVVVWYDPQRLDRLELFEAIEKGLGSDPEATAHRAPRSGEVSNGDLVRLAVGGFALAVLGIRRYGLRRPALLGPSGRTVATGVTVFTGYPFLRGALRSATRGRGAGTDALVSAATLASLVLRENVVALTVLWLLNIGEYLQALTLRRSRRAISELLTGTQTRIWTRIASGGASSRSRSTSITCAPVTRSWCTSTWCCRSTVSSSTVRESSIRLRSPGRRCRSRSVSV
jgi:cation-transporting P-type ATPase C